MAVVRHDEVVRSLVIALSALCFMVRTASGAHCHVGCLNTESCLRNSDCDGDDVCIDGRCQLESASASTVATSTVATSTVATGGSGGMPGTGGAAGSSGAGGG